MMAGFMSKECLDAMWQVTLHIGEMKGILIAEGANQSIEWPDDWMALPVALPTDADLQEHFDIISASLSSAVPDIASECMEVFPKFPSVKQLTANGAAEDFQFPFSGEIPDTTRSDFPPVGEYGAMKPYGYRPRPGGKATDAYQLWNQLSAAEDSIMDWVNEIFLEPSRYAMAGVPR
jgi:hypothetical protein